MTVRRHCQDGVRARNAGNWIELKAAASYVGPYKPGAVGGLRSSARLAKSALT